MPSSPRARSGSAESWSFQCPKAQRTTPHFLHHHGPHCMSSASERPRFGEVVVHGVEDRLLDFPAYRVPTIKTIFRSRDWKMAIFPLTPTAAACSGFSSKAPASKMVQSGAKLESAPSGNEQCAGEQRMPRFFGHHTHTATIAFIKRRQTHQICTNLRLNQDILGRWTPILKIALGCTADSLCPSQCCRGCPVCLRGTCRRGDRPEREPVCTFNAPLAAK